MEGLHTKCTNLQRCTGTYFSLEDTVFNAVKSVKQNLFVDEAPDPHNGRTPGSGSSRGKTLPKKKLLV